MHKQYFWICLFLFTVICPASHAETHSNSLLITEETIPTERNLPFSNLYDVENTVHPNVVIYARLAGIDIKKVEQALKLTFKKSGRTMVSIGPNERYKTSGYRSTTVKIFELVPVRIAGQQKILVVYNDRTLDETEIDNFHKGWVLAVLSRNYQVEKLQNLYTLSKHRWPGGEAIFTNLDIKGKVVVVTLTYEQAIQGFENYTRLFYSFRPDRNGWLKFISIKENTEDGPVP